MPDRRREQNERDGLINVLLFLALYNNRLGGWGKDQQALGSPYTDHLFSFNQWVKQKKKLSGSPIHTFDVDGGILPAVVLYSLPLENNDQCFRLYPAALIYLEKPNRMVVHKLVDRLVSNHSPHAWIKDQNSSGPCSTR